MFFILKYLHTYCNNCICTEPILRNVKFKVAFLITYNYYYRHTRKTVDCYLNNNFELSKNFSCRWGNNDW